MKSLNLMTLYLRQRGGIHIIFDRFQRQNKTMLPVYEKDGFLFFKSNRDSDIDDRLIIDQSKIDETCVYMLKNNLKNISVNSRYFFINDLNFLKRMSFIENIAIVDDKHDITPLNDLHGLREIRSGEYIGQLDLQNFPDLEKLGVTYSNKLKNLGKAENLKWLWLDNFKQESLEDMQNMKKLTYMYLYKPSILSLKGISNLLSLKELNLDTASKLESLEGLSETLEQLETIYIYSSKKLEHYEILSKAKSLKHLELRKTGEAKSINFIRHLKKLKKVVLGFKVADGNMSYLKGIEEVGFIDFPHYSHKMKDLK